MQQDVSLQNKHGLRKFFRNQVLGLSESDIIELDKKFQNEIKQLKYDTYKIGWYMRGSMTYHDLMHTISADDREIFGKIIKENIETVEKTKLPLL